MIKKLFSKNLSRANKVFLLIFALLVPQLVGFIGSLFTMTSVQVWYSEIYKPAFTPPSFVFAPVWIVLFLMMGIAFYLVLIEIISGKKATLALLIFGIQLVLNGLWSMIFFGLQNPQLAFFELCVLFVFILLNIWAFARVSKPAAWLLVPYAGWVVFAGFLNFAIWTKLL
ncbi:MAG: TspO/MBR family protein [Patescibacteria group bacterium]|nr:tryptophan-rich sensory protein [Patescibacteria group bacterium]